jgi:hypothetical protein
MSELSRLLVKAIRTLPGDDQDTVLAELLETRLGAPPAPGRLPALLHAGLPDPGARLYGEAVPEGGPWQTVPVRLSTEQHEQLKRWCHANGFTMAVVLRGLVARFLDAQARRPGGTTVEGPAAADT